MVNLKNHLTLKTLLLISIAIGFIGIYPAGIAQQKKPKVIRVGYFHGGRTALMMRAYEKQEFARRGLNIEFHSKPLRGKEYSLLPRSIKKFNKDGVGRVGKARGTELIEAMLAGEFDLAMVGENSFVLSIYNGKPIVAVAELGHDVKEHSGHVLLMRKGLTINKPEDYFGKILISRRAGPGDSIFLKEFLEREGIDLDKDILQLEKLPRNLEEKERLPKDKVIIVDQLYEDKMHKGLENGVIDGGYFHLMAFEYLDPSFYLIQPLHQWADPELSHALLVCTKDFLRDNADNIVTLLEVYIERIKYEHSLSYEERTRKQEKGLQMAINLYGLNYPQYDIVPTVDINLLYEVLNLLRKYNFVGDKPVKIENFVDNSLIFEALKNLNITAKDDFWQSEY